MCTFWLMAKDSAFYRRSPTCDRPLKATCFRTQSLRHNFTNPHPYKSTNLIPFFLHSSVSLFLSFIVASAFFSVKTMGKFKSVVTEVAPPRFISVTRRRMKKILDTIVEEDKDFGCHLCFCSSTCDVSSDRPLLSRTF